MQQWPCRACGVQTTFMKLWLCWLEKTSWTHRGTEPSWRAWAELTGHRSSAQAKLEGATGLGQGARGWAGSLPQAAHVPPSALRMKPGPVTPGRSGVGQAWVKSLGDLLHAWVSVTTSVKRR